MLQKFLTSVSMIVLCSGLTACGCFEHYTFTGITGWGDKTSPSQQNQDTGSDANTTLETNMAHYAERGLVTKHPAHDVAKNDSIGDLRSGMHQHSHKGIVATNEEKVGTACIDVEYVTVSDKMQTLGFLKTSGSSAQSAPYAATTMPYQAPRSAHQIHKPVEEVQPANPEYSYQEEDVAPAPAKRNKVIHKVKRVTRDKNEEITATPVEKASKSGSKSSRKAKKPADVTQAPHSNIQETPLAPIASTASPVESSMKSDSNGMTVMPVQIPQSVTPSPQQYNEAPVAATPHLAPEQTSVPAPAQIPDPAASANLPMPQSSTPAAPGMSSSAPNSPTSIPHLDGTTAQSVAPSNSPTTLPQTPRAPVSNQVGMANQAAPHEIGGVPASESMSTRMSALQYTDNDIELKAEHMAMLDKIIADLKSDASKTVKVQSYGFSKSGDAIEARRNSLQRAIKIRKYLIEKDVSASRISVHAIEDSSNTQNKVELQIESGSASR